MLSTSFHALCCSSVLNISAPGFPWVRTFGAPGSGSVLGQPPQLSLTFGGGMCLSPWTASSSSVLVPDNANQRVVEIDFVTGLLVKVWVTGVDYPMAVAATASLIAVASHGASVDRVAFYDLSGTLLRGFGGPGLGALDTSSLGVALGYPWSLQFSQDQSTIVVSEAWSQRVTRWGVSNVTLVSGK
jgi:hypothetical protein